jgi:hypothetical protein
VLSVDGRTAITWPRAPVSASSSEAVTALIARVLENSSLANQFQISIDPQLAVNGKDSFVLENGSVPGSIAINASTPVAAAWAFNHYLKYVAEQSGLSDSMRQRSNICSSLLVREKSATSQQTIVASAESDFYRWYGNPCTFSYSSVFWNFTR